MRHLITSKKTTWFRSPMIAIVLIIFIVCGSISVIRAYAKQHEAVSLRDQSAREYDQMQEKKQNISRSIENLSSTRGIESEVRNRYRVVKPGEQLVIVVDNKDQVQSSVPEKTFWQKVRDFAGL